MNPRQLTVIILRLFALYCLYTAVAALFGLTMVYAMPENTGLPDIMWPLLFKVVIPFFGFLLLWFFPHTIAGIISKTRHSSSDEPTTATGWLRLFIIALGMYWLVYAFLDATYWLSLNHYFGDSAIEGFTPQDKASMIATLIEFITGLVLLTKNAWITQVVVKLNAPAGQRPAESGDQSD
jgi:hypothetical protein